jgi:hypothetical protein
MQAPYPFPASHSDGTAPVYITPNEKTGEQRLMLSPRFLSISACSNLGESLATPAGIVEGKINVHLVPHTHDDTGWQVTVDQYFFTEVYYVVDTVVDQLLKNPNRHFICKTRSTALCRMSSASVSLSSPSLPSPLVL